MATPIPPWTGGDSSLRRLRVLTAITLLILIAYIVILDPDPDPVSLGTLAGVLLVDLGYEAGVFMSKGGK